MAQYDVHRGRSDGDLVLDCQTDAMAHYDTRLAVPLMPPDRAPKPAAWLNPTLRVDGQDYVMVTQFAATIAARDLGTVVTSLIHDRYTIARALDFLLTGI